MESDSTEDDLLLINNSIPKFSRTASVPVVNPLLDKGKTRWSDGSLNIFPFASGQGNFILLKHHDRIMVLDGGTQSPGFSGSNAFAEGKSPSNWDEFLVKNMDILSEIFSKAQISAVLITHPDSDHYAWLGGLFDFAYEKNNNNKLSEVSFFLGEKGKDFEYCRSIAEKRCDKYFLYSRKISQNFSFQETLKARGIPERQVEDPWIQWVPYRPGEDFVPVYSNYEIENLLHNIMGANISFLNPIAGVVCPMQNNNSNSIVVCINFGVGTVLFTGDATGNTMDAIYGDTKSPDTLVSAVSRRNRSLLRRVNFLIAPHHGSETEGSPFWLSQIIKLSSNSFVGTIFCAPSYSSQFKHPNRYIDTILFPASAKSWAHEIEYYRAGRQRKKTTTNSLFITAFAKYGTYWLNLSENGMFLFSDESGELEQLMSKNGWSMYTDRLLNLGYTNNWNVFFPIVLHNPQELSVHNAQGETPFIQALRIGSLEFVKKLLSAALLISDDQTFEQQTSVNEIDQYLHNTFKIRGISFRRSLNFLFKKNELNEKDLNILGSSNDPLINQVFHLITQ